MDLILGFLVKEQVQLFQPIVYEGIVCGIRPPAGENMFRTGKDVGSRLLPDALREGADICWNSPRSALERAGAVAADRHLLVEDAASSTARHNHSPSVRARTEAGLRRSETPAVNSSGESAQAALAVRLLFGK
jgi:hypothetical protein